MSKIVGLLLLLLPVLHSFAPKMLKYANLKKLKTTKYVLE